MFTLHKKVFSAAPVKLFFFRAQITQMFLFFRMPVGRDESSHFNDNTLSKIYSTMEVLGMRLPYVERYFQPHERDRRSHFNNDTF